MMDPIERAHRRAILCPDCGSSEFDWEAPTFVCKKCAARFVA